MTEKTLLWSTSMGASLSLDAAALAAAELAAPLEYFFSSEMKVLSEVAAPTVSSAVLASYD